jgi:hypothetical protein
MSPVDPDAEHYVVQATNMPPTELVCKCGEIMTGDDCLDRMVAHIDEGNGFSE